VGSAVGAPEFFNPSVTLDVAPSDGDNLSSPATITVRGTGFGSNDSGTIIQCTFDVATQFDICSDPLAIFTSDASGTFSRPVAVTSTFTGFDAQNQQVGVDCLQVDCTVQAITDNGLFHSQHHISFAGASTSTSSTFPPPSTTPTIPTSSSSTFPTSSTIPTSSSSTLLTSTTSSPSTSTTLASSTTTSPPSSRCSELHAARAQFNTGIDQSAAAANALPADQRDALLDQLAAVRAQGNAQFDQALADAGCGSEPPPTSSTSTTIVSTSTTSSTVPDGVDDDDGDEVGCAPLQEGRDHFDQLETAFGDSATELAGRLDRLAALFDRVCPPTG